jgi:stress-induced morphogen
MYQITVHAPSFKGVTKVEQHKQLTSLLKTEIKTMHGLIIDTKAV